MAGEKQKAKSPAKTEAKAAQQTKASPFTLGEGFVVIPAKVVGRIQKGEFVDMAELLSDNIKLAEKCLDTSSSADGVAKHTQVRKRELQEDAQGLFSWVEAFNMFSCILVGQHPEMVKPLAAYQTLIIREARRFNYRG